MASEDRRGIDVGVNDYEVWIEHSEDEGGFYAHVTDGRCKMLAVILNDGDVFSTTDEAENAANAWCYERNPNA